jgi:hypothetical protein
MRRLISSVVCNWTVAAPVWMVFVPLATVGPVRGADNVTVEQVRAAWERRRESIRSFQYECELEEYLVKGSLNNVVEPSNKPRGKDVPNEDLILHSTIAFALSGSKIACCEEGEQWDEDSGSIEIRKFRSTFDGIQNKTLFDEAPLAEALVDSGGKAADALTVDVNLIAIWLAYSPADLLQRLGCNSDRMRVSDLHGFRDGHNCVELSMPRRNPAWRALVCVDPSRDYVPLQFTMKKDDVLRSDRSIQYVRDEQVGWRVSAWHEKRFNTSGGLERSSSGEVKRFSINQPLGDEVFRFQFPEGTHVVEGHGDTAKYYIALGDGKKREIARKEFGVSLRERPDGTPWIRFTLAAVGVVVILALVLVLRWRHERR